MGMYSVVATKDLPEAIGDGMAVYAISRNDGKKGKSGLVAVMPAISDSVFNLFQIDPAGKAFIVDAIEGLRSKLASGLYAKGKTITDDSIGITALLGLARIETESQRMTKEAIGVWFDADLAGLVADAIRLKMIGIAEDKLTKLVEAYKMRFQTLAGREPNVPDDVKAQLIRAMEFLPDDYESVIGEKVASALAAATEAKEVLVAL